MEPDGAVVYDYGIIGAGCFGAAAARHLSSSGEEGVSPSVLIVGAPECHMDDISPDQAPPLPSDRQVFAEHYDEGRITRCTSPDRLWARVGRESIGRYRELERASGVAFFVEAGSLTVGQADDQAIAKIMQDETGRGQVELLDPVQLRAAFPHLTFKPHHCGVYEAKRAGYISPRAQIRAHLAVAIQAGAVHVPSVATRVRQDDDSTTPLVVIKTEDGAVYRARKVLLATGGFTNFGQLLPQALKLQLRLTTHTTVLGEVSEQDGEHRLSGLPSLVWCSQAAEYALPPIRYPDGRLYVKLGHDETMGRPLPDEQSVSAWYREGGGDSEVARFLQQELQALLPTTTFLSWRTRACVISKTSTGYPFVGMLSRAIGVAVGGNGSGAKGADEWGRMAAMVLRGEPLPDPQEAELLRPRLLSEPGAPPGLW